MSVRQKLRLIIFVVVTVLAGLLYGYAATLLPVPWTDVPVDRPGVAPADLRWDLALMGVSTGLVFAGTLLALAWRPLTKPLLIQCIAVSLVLDSCVEVAFRGPAYLVLALPGYAVVAAYPRLRSLLQVGPARPLRAPFVLVGGLTGIVLLIRVAFAVWQQAGLSDGGPATDLGWIDDAAHTVAIAVAALLAVTGRPGWRILAALVGVGLCYVGVASLGLLDARGSWGPVGGGLACAAGLSYLLAAAWPAAVTARPSTSDLSDMAATPYRSAGVRRVRQSQQDARGGAA
jgi:hypothetical protein